MGAPVWLAEKIEREKQLKRSHPTLIELANMSNMDEIAHALSAMINDVIKLEHKEENDDSPLAATRILKANMEWMKEVTKYEVSELQEILQMMSNQQHEHAVDFLCRRLGIIEYGLIKQHSDRSCWLSNRKW